MPRRSRRRHAEASTLSANSEPVDTALRALADGNRRTILALVRDRPWSVSEVAHDVGVSQQIASHHLRVLRDAGLVTERREGTRHLFVLRTDGIALVSEYLDGFWPTHLAKLKRAAEESVEKRGHDA